MIYRSIISRSAAPAAAASCHGDAVAPQPRQGRDRRDHLEPDRVVPAALADHQGPPVLGIFLLGDDHAAGIGYSIRRTLIVVRGLDVPPVAQGGVLRQHQFAAALEREHHVRPAHAADPLQDGLHGLLRIPQGHGPRRRGRALLRRSRGGMAGPEQQPSAQQRPQQRVLVAADHLQGLCQLSFVSVHAFSSSQNCFSAGMPTSSSMHTASISL